MFNAVITAQHRLRPGPDLDGCPAEGWHRAGLGRRPDFLVGRDGDRPAPARPVWPGQFYPDAIVNTCSSDGGFNVTYAPNKFSVCSPAWQVTTTGNQ